MSKIVCVYHSIDLDGQMSAAIVKHWFNQQEVPNKEGEDCNTIDFIGYNYGQPIPDLSEYDKVIMCDISFPKEEMSKLFTEKGFNNIVWIDHHISAIEDVNNEFRNKTLGYINGLRDTKFAACELTWQYFFPNETIPEIVRLLGRYDCFGHKGTDEELKVLEFQYGARQYISNYEEAYYYLLKSFESIIKYDYVNQYTIENIIHEKGKSIYQYLCIEAKQAYNNGFTIILKEPDSLFKNPTNKQYKNRSFICINKERFNPINFGINYHIEGYDGCACFHYANGMVNFSLYNDNGLVDCSQIAKQFGGGGHKGAAGFRITLQQFIKLIL